MYFTVWLSLVHSPDCVTEIEGTGIEGSLCLGWTPGRPFQIQLNWNVLSRSTWRRAGESDYRQGASPDSDPDGALLAASSFPLRVSCSRCHCTGQFCISSWWHHTGSTWPDLVSGDRLLLQRCGCLSSPPRTHSNTGGSDELRYSGETIWPMRDGSFICSLSPFFSQVYWMVRVSWGAVLQDQATGQI